MTIFYIKKFADFVKITIINLVYNIYGILAKDTFFFNKKVHFVQ